MDERTCLSVCDMIFNGILEDALLIQQKIKFNKTYFYSLYGNVLNQTLLNTSNCYCLEWSMVDMKQILHSSLMPEKFKLISIL